MTDAAGRDGSKSEDGGGSRPDLAGVLHDVSNALTVLLGWVGEACAPDATPETVAHALELIGQRARVARDLARQAIGGPAVDEPHRAATAVAEEVIDALQVEASHAGVTLALRSDAAGGTLGASVAGAVDLAQVLTNLVMNAIAHAPPGTSVDVELSADDAACALLVTDRGPGVPEALRAAIFEGTSRRKGGTGVGLRHSRDVARSRGGDVILVAGAPATRGGGASGATFRVSWPRAGADLVPRPRASSTSGARQELTGVRVLVIEDDEAVTQLLETALEGRGADVTVVAKGEELPGALDAGPYHAALVDLSPLAADVTSALARLRASSPGIDLVLISGSADRLPAAVASEPMKLVRKPFELSEVLAALTKPEG